MKRRSFLKKAPIAGAAALGAASIRGSRLYGEPGSISTKTTVDNVVDAMLPSLFRLHTTIAGGSSAYTSARLATCRLALLLIKDEAFAQSFLNNPDDVMQRFGLSDLAVNKSNYEHNLVAALANSDVRKAA